MSYRASPRSVMFETMILQHNTITISSNQKYMSDVYFKSMHYRWRYLKPFGTAEKNENSVSKACTVTVFETIWTAEIFVITMSLKHVLWRYLKRFGTAEKSFKTMSLKNAFWCCFKRVGTFMSRLMSAHPSPPLAFIFYCILGTLFFGLQGLHLAATPLF